MNEGSSLDTSQLPERRDNRAIGARLLRSRAPGRRPTPIRDKRDPIEACRIPAPQIIRVGADGRDLPG
jgi:hypothetical protein